MTGSVRTDARRLRAQRRARFPAVRVRRPSPGRHHPASAVDVRRALRSFGPEAYYGVASVELMRAPSLDGRLVFGEVAGAGRIVLYDQPKSPWRLGAALRPEQRAELQAAGADVSEEGVVSWPGDSLRAFMLGHVLAHELGHHTLQHERHLRGERAARSRDHEARAAVIAARLRRLLD